MSKKKPIAIIITMLTLLILTASVPPARAQFVLSSWDFPDAYGQGIEAFRLFENSTGDWLVTAGPYYQHWYYQGPEVFNWNVSVGIKIRVYTTLNLTLTGATDTDEGKNYQRHNVTVFDISDVLVFSQQNFTYYSVEYVPPSSLAYYQYDIVLNFLPEYGQYYTVTVIYEVFW